MKPIKKVNEKEIYLDSAATTKANADIVALFNDIETNQFGNANSTHHLGRSSALYLDKAREMILNSLELKDYKVIFTSSSTEALNLAIKGYCLNYQNRGKTIITTNIEHPAVKESLEWLKKYFGFQIKVQEVDSFGQIDIEKFKSDMTNDVVMVTMMLVNNETGSITNLKEVSEIVKSYPKCVLLSDTTQAIGKIPYQYNILDMFVVSGHKIHGLKGSGALILKKNISLAPITSGGGQEEGLRSGTSSVGLDVALAKSIQTSMKSLKTNYEVVSKIHEYLVKSLKNLKIHANSPLNCSPYIYNFSLLEKKAAVVVEGLSRRHIYVSSVSACHSKGEPMSEVVMNMFHDEKLARNTLRVSLDSSISLEDIDVFVENLKDLMEGIK